MARGPTTAPARARPGGTGGDRATGPPQPAPIPGLRKARADDLDAIVELEAACFQPHRLASRASLRRSIASPHQAFWVVERGQRLVALLVLWRFPHRVRVYDIATHPDFRGEGLGRALMAHTDAFARKAGATLVTLEAEAADTRLVRWYEQQGFTIVERLADFYPGGRAAVRMRKGL